MRQQGMRPQVATDIHCRPSIASTPFLRQKGIHYSEGRAFDASQGGGFPDRKNTGSLASTSWGVWVSVVWPIPIYQRALLAAPSLYTRGQSVDLQFLGSILVRRASGCMGLKVQASARKCIPKRCRGLTEPTTHGQPSSTLLIFRRLTTWGQSLKTID